MSIFSKQVATAKASAIEAAKNIALKPLLLRNPEVKAAFNTLPAKVRKDAMLALSTYGNVVFISVTMYDLDSFKDKKLTSILERFLDWKTTTNEYTSGLPNKDFRFDKKCHDAKVGDFEISVSVYAYVKSDSPLCRIVVTGVTEEIVRKETKQIVCA
ncbi:hypothetical protein K0U83_03150 [bacterium]|nr:hypothetical protein [bacterium]